MLENKSGFATGDIYFQTRVSILKEKRKRPSIILNGTLKTASGSSFSNRRYFNTAGYYFDAEIGKSFQIHKTFFDELRIVGDVGFFSWDVQTPNLNVQDDALMYGVKMILKKEKISWENTIAGYHGWINRSPDYGNKPLVFATKINFFQNKSVYFLQFQQGIKYFPYSQIRLGVIFSLDSLTPQFF